MSTNTIITIPPPDSLRADIRTRAAELRALRRLLRLAEAALAVEDARSTPSHDAEEKAADRPEVDRLSTGEAHS
jgi:hypothetical protein